MPIYPSVWKSNPIPFLLSKSSPTPVVLPIVSRASLPASLLKSPKTRETIRTELESHNPVKLLYEARRNAGTAGMLNGVVRPQGNSSPLDGFPRNLKIESTVDEGARWLEHGQRGVARKYDNIPFKAKKKLRKLINKLP